MRQCNLYCAHAVIFVSSDFFGTKLEFYAEGNDVRVPEFLCFFAPGHITNIGHCILHIEINTNIGQPKWPIKKHTDFPAPVYIALVVLWHVFWSFIVLAFKLILNKTWAHTHTCNDNIMYVVKLVAWNLSFHIFTPNWFRGFEYYSLHVWIILQWILLVKYFFLILRMHIEFHFGNSNEKCIGCLYQTNQHRSIGILRFSHSFQLLAPSETKWNVHSLRVNEE